MLSFELVTGDIAVRSECSTQELVRLPAPAGYQPGKSFVSVSAERLWQQWLEACSDPTWEDWYGPLKPPTLNLHARFGDLVTERPLFNQTLAAEELAWEEEQKALVTTEGRSSQSEGDEGGGMLLMGDPCDSNEPFATSVSIDALGWIHLSWPGCSSFAYGVFTTESLSLTNFWTAQEWLSGVAPVMTWVDPQAVFYPARFYSIQRVPLATDGIPDWWRLQYFGSTTTNSDSCAACDPDNDGYTNLQEFHFVSDPTNAVSHTTALPPHLAAWWKLDEGSGTLTVDSSGNDNNGSVQSAGAQWVGGIASNALGFYGVPDSNVSVPPAGSLDNSNALTVVAWVNTTNSADRGLISYRAVEYTNGWRLFYSTTQIVFQWATGEPWYRQLTVPGPLPSNQWVQVTATFSQNWAAVYVNGVLTNFTTDAGTNLMFRFSDNPLTIGRVYHGSQYPFPGRIDEVRIYSRALNAGEVAALYNMDTDGDGIPNVWELQNGINPLDPADAAASATTDGLTYWDLWTMGDDFQGTNSLARLYVDVSATNAGNGTATSPFQHLQQGVDAVPTNDSRIFIIHVAPGVYDENVQITNRRNVMVVGSNAFTTVLSGNSGDQPVVGASAFNFLRLKGLTIRDGITKTNGAGVMANAPSGRLFVTHCVISDNFAWQNGGAIWCNVSSNSMLLNNIIAHNEADTGGGVYIAGGQLSLLQNTIVTNIADLGTGGAIYAASTSSVSAANCVLWHNGSNATANVSVQYSLVDPAGGTTGTGNFTNAPSFVSESLQDYHVHSDSPVRGAGVSNFVYDDIDGEGRPLPGQARDVGADQYVDGNGHGIADYWEQFYGFGGLFDVSDPNGDADNDSFTNLQEFNAGTDPTEPDGSSGFSESQEFSLLSSSTPCFVCTNLLPTQTGMILGTVTAGSNYSYQASGCIKFQSTEPGGSADPDGRVSQDHCATFSGPGTANSGFLCPGLNSYSLVGKINGANCFQMGSSGSFTASASGTLTVYFNDDVWNDNSGSWTVCIGANAEAQKLIDTNQLCNLIPDPYGKGLPANKLYVAQRASGKAELQIQTTLSPSMTGIGKKFVWGVLDDSGSLLAESGTLQDNGTATVAFTPTGDHKVYTIRIGCDQNDNGKLDSGEIIETPSTPFKVLVITQNDYNPERSFLNTWAAGWGSIIYPVAANLLKGFLNATVPAGGTATTGPLSASDGRLTHIAGAAFGSPSCTTTVTNYDFATTTKEGKKVEKSDAFQTNLVVFLKSQTAEVTAFFAANTTSASNTFVWAWNDPNFKFNKAGLLSPDTDLYYVFHDVQFQTTVTATILSNLSVAAVLTTGSITDLYDFNYEQPSTFDLIRRAATVQIGWHVNPSNSGGGIFTGQVEINTTRNKCKHL